MSLGYKAQAGIKCCEGHFLSLLTLQGNDGSRNVHNKCLCVITMSWKCHFNPLKFAPSFFLHNDNKNLCFLTND